MLGPWNLRALGLGPGKSRPIIFFWDDPSRRHGHPSSLLALDRAQLARVQGSIRVALELGDLDPGTLELGGLDSKTLELGGLDPGIGGLNPGTLERAFKGKPVLREGF